MNAATAVLGVVHDGRQLACRDAVDVDRRDAHLAAAGEDERDAELAFVRVGG